MPVECLILQAEVAIRVVCTGHDIVLAYIEKQRLLLFDVYLIGDQNKNLTSLPSLALTSLRHMFGGFALPPAPDSSPRTNTSLLM